MRNSFDDQDDNPFDRDLGTASPNKGSQIPADQSNVADLKARANLIIEEEKQRSWSAIFLMLALSRQFTFYLILITFWMHIYQIGVSPYFGALGYAFLYGFMILGTNFVRKSLSNHNTGGMTTSAPRHSDGFYLQTNDSSIIQPTSHRYSEHEGMSARPTTVFYSNIIGQQGTMPIATDGSDTSNTWDTVKAYLILSAVILFVTACLLFGVSSGSFSGFLLILCFAMLGFQQGAQRSAEDVYIHNSVDKQLIERTLSRRMISELVGATLASLVSYMLSGYA